MNRSNLPPNKKEINAVHDRFLRERAIVRRAEKSGRTFDDQKLRDEKLSAKRSRRRAARKLRREQRALEPQKVVVTYPRSGPSPSDEKKKAFYASWDWRTLRMEVLKTFGHRCQSCGAQPGETTVGGQPVKIVVDHIKPISRFWALRLERSNLQVLCDECNQGKGAWDETDYRPSVETPRPVEMTDSWDDFDKAKVN